MESPDFEKNLKDLATQVDELPPLPVDEVPATKSKTTLYWTVGIIGAVILGALEAGVIMIEGDLGAPPPPPEVLVSLDNDPCIAQMSVIMTAVSRYAHDKGAPPARLSDLDATYLSVPPIDTVSGKPFEYSVNGDAVSLACPPAAISPQAVSQ